MIEGAILPAMHARFAAAVAAAATSLRPLIVDGVTLGWMDDARARKLSRFDTVFRIEDGRVAFAPEFNDVARRSAALADVTNALREAGEFPAWRDELYAAA